MSGNTKALRDEQIQRCETNPKLGEAGLINREEIIRYVQRLLASINNGDCFALQFSRGEGNELTKHFWSPRSSSRLAFDFFSVLAKCKKVQTIEFEKILIGIVGSPKRPDMDVYFETDTDVCYIESKYCEYVTNNKRNNGFLRINEMDSDNALLSPAYWDKSNKEKLEHHFHNRNDVAEAFSDFVVNENKKAKGLEKNDQDWFFAKQECTHLFGILFDCLAKISQTPAFSKNVHFYNIVFNVDGKEEISDFARDFFNEAKRSFARFFPNSYFEYEPIWYQDIYSRIPENATLFGEDATNLKMYLKDHFPGIDVSVEVVNSYFPKILQEVFSTCDK
jgi:hypothetical protein